MLDPTLKFARPKARVQMKRTNHMSQYLKVIKQANTVINLLIKLWFLCEKLSKYQRWLNLINIVYVRHSLVELAKYGHIIDKY